MKRLIWVGGFIAIAICTHMAVVRMAPSTIMSKVMNVMAERGLPLHQFSLSPRITPKTQTIVRPSPDLAYSLCRFDLSEGPILIMGTRWNGYGSLTIFDAETNAVFITSLDTASPNSNPVILTLDAGVQPSAGIHVLKLDKPKGLALIRRLAPTTELYNQAHKSAKSDICTAYRP